MALNFSKKRFKALAMTMARQGAGLERNGADRDEHEAIVEDTELVLKTLELLIQRTPGGQLVDLAREVMGGATPQFNFEHE